MKLPDLHRVVDNKADWEGIPLDEMNAYQLRAHRTGGIDTPGNRETLKGAVASWVGLELIDNDSLLAGTALLGFGRIKDLTDGKIADETQTKSPLGAAFDAGTDTLLLAKAVPVLRRKGIISGRESTAITSTLALKVAATSIAAYTEQNTHVSRLGKVAGFLTWSGVGSRLLGTLMSEHVSDKAGRTLLRAGRNLTLAGTAAAGIAGADYFHQAVTKAK